MPAPWLAVLAPLAYTAPSALEQDTTAVAQDPAAVVVTGHRSSVFLTTSPLLSDGAVCLHFAIRPRGRSPDTVRIASSGLGEVRFWEATDGTGECPTPPAAAAGVLVLTGELGEARRVVGRIDAGGIPKGFGSLAGEVVVFADQREGVVLPVTVRERPHLRFVTAFLWFWGIFVPAAVSAVLGILGKRWYDERMRRAEQERGFEAFVAQHQKSIMRFFQDYLPTVAEKDDAALFESLANELAERSILQSLPEAERRKMLALLNQRDRSGCANLLAELFPVYQGRVAVLETRPEREPVHA